MTKKVKTKAPELATAQEAETQSVETQALQAPQSNPKEAAMAAKKKAVKPTKATTAHNAGSNPATHFNNSTNPPDCQGKMADSVAEIPSWTDVKAQLRESLRASIEQTHAELEEAKERIARAQAKRQEELAQARAKVEKLEAQFETLGSELAKVMAIARQTLSGKELDEAVGQINLAHAAETEQLEGELNDAKMALAALEAADEAACEDERLELQMLQARLEELEELDPEVAREVELRLSAESNARKAIRLARNGEIAEAQEALELAKAGQAPADLLARAEKAIAEAERRREIRVMIARIQAVDPASREAMAQLQELAEEAERKGIMENVVSFLNYVKKLALQAERVRRREEARLWKLARQEARRWAEHGVPQSGAVLKYGPGVIKVFIKTDKGYILDSVHLLRDGVWRKRSQPGRAVLSEVKGKNVVVVK